MSRFSPNFFPILFNALLGASSNRRGEIAECVEALARITEPHVVESFFKKVVMRILETIKEVGRHRRHRCRVLVCHVLSPFFLCTRQLAEADDPDKAVELIHKQSAMLDLSNSLASALSWNQQLLLWKAMHNLIQDDNPEIQKRAYTVASCILKRSARREEEKGSDGKNRNGNQSLRESGWPINSVWSCVPSAGFGNPAPMAIAMAMAMAMAMAAPRGSWQNWKRSKRILLAHTPDRCQPPGSRG